MDEKQNDSMKINANPENPKYHSKSTYFEKTTFIILYTYDTKNIFYWQLRYFYIFFNFLILFNKFYECNIQI